jgi:hypothetical protein
MKRDLFWFTLIAVLLCQPSRAEDAKVTVQMKGIGSLTCAHWRSTQATRAEGTVWILGFWSGLNYVAAASEQAQPKADETEMMAHVEKACAHRPSQILASAVWTAYLDSNKK